MSKRRAFTLIELLVVIAIIAILAAILFPVFAKAREKARQSSCSSNVKQLSLAFLQYAQDYDETFPHVYDDGLAPGGALRIIWADKIYPYAKNRQVYACPSANPNMAPAGGWPDSLRGTRYQMCMTHVMPEGASNQGRRMAELVSVAETLMLAESSNAWWTHFCARHSTWGTGGPIISSNGRPALIGSLGETTYGWHNEGSNVGFFDGHVKWMQITALADPNQRYLFDYN